MCHAVLISLDWWMAELKLSEDNSTVGASPEKLLELEKIFENTLEHWMLLETYYKVLFFQQKPGEGEKAEAGDEVDADQANEAKSKTIEEAHEAKKAEWRWIKDIKDAFSLALKTLGDGMLNSDFAAKPAQSLVSLLAEASSLKVTIPKKIQNLLEEVKEKHS